MDETTSSLTLSSLELVDEGTEGPAVPPGAGHVGHSDTGVVGHTPATPFLKGGNPVRAIAHLFKVPSLFSQILFNLLVQKNSVIIIYICKKQEK